MPTTVDETEDLVGRRLGTHKSVNSSTIAMPTKRAALSGAKAPICSMRALLPQRIASSCIGDNRARTRG